MHRSIFAAVIASTCLAATSALAADIARPVYKAAPAPAPFSWTGFYLGGHAGYGWGGADGSITPNAGIFSPQFFNLDSDGVVAGAQIGYNWQINPNWVAGVEADISGTGIRGAAFAPGTLPSGVPNQGWQHHMNRDVEWLATLRGRVGYAWDRALLYVTGGFAWGKVNDEAYSTIGTSLSTASLSGTRSGYTVGGGLERAFATNWSAKLEYLYYNLDGGSVASGSVPAGVPATNSWDDVNLHVVRAGVNYRFGDSGSSAYAADLTRGGVYKVAPVAAYNWTGFYVGGHAGYGWGDTETNIPANGLLYDAAVFKVNGDGAIAGAQLGYNWQVTPQWVLGLEADISGTGIADQVLATQTVGGVPATAGFTHFTSRDINWLATVRGRIGYSWDRTLAYITGGVAFGDIHYETATAWNGIGFNPASFSKVRSGWALGGGLEWAVAGNWTAKLEYLYYDLDGTTLITPGNFGFSTTHNWDDTKVNVVRAGVNYKFGSPVIAKY